KAEAGAEVLFKGSELTFKSEDGKGDSVSPGLRVDAESGHILAVEMTVERGEVWKAAWATEVADGLQDVKFRVKADGRPRTYNVSVGSDDNWRGKIAVLQLGPASGTDVKARVRSIMVTDELQGPAEIEIVKAIMSEAVNRAGKPAPMLFHIRNTGGSDSGAIKLECVSLPRGVRIASPEGWEAVARVPALDSATHRLSIISDKAVKGNAVFRFSGQGMDKGEKVSVPIEITPNLKLPQAEYVPEPQPLENPYEIGALYFPGWSRVEAWERIWKVAPERKPALGWYDEANPEVVDWQIKWAAENGLSYFLVDWYWHKGQQHHDHWIKAYKQARYRKHLKWAVMWANHNGEGSHSEADQAEVAKFWIENYFNMPEYYQIDGKPVVMIWSAYNMNRDLGSNDGCKRLLDLSRRLAVEAGHKGIYFIAMKWPEASVEPAVVQSYKDMGFDMTSIYHYMHHGGKAKNTHRFHFDLVADSNYDHWKGLHETGILPFLPNLSTGWDDRPWHGDRGTEIYGRTVEHFRRICSDAKRFADETGVKRLVLAPINEWGEGSYAEPNAEFGFGMYEAVRDTFCLKPADGWPMNYVPSDVGLGPYDLPIPQPDLTREWTFREGECGWQSMMGIGELRCGTDGMAFKSNTNDPALMRHLSGVYANEFKGIAIRMKVEGVAPGQRCQLFWETNTAPISEASSASIPLKDDGGFHDYVLDVGASRFWLGKITRLRFDPVNQAGVSVTIESIRLLPVE
ncbi:MAG: glycoside hydrolase family 99-like domain-containing protein, partial [Kiritimatiellae bacterium]|nr:glycoside hydrolase family 99-like domain-containing protein [Kiritimatiellia bacterium]